MEWEVCEGVILKNYIMKKQIILLFALFPLWGLGGIYAQKELWGVNKGADDGGANPLGYNGNITKYDINGQNPVIMHEFVDFTNGKTPKGKLILASNGKLYGITIAGGITVVPPVTGDNGSGVLYEYDLVLNKYRVLHNFNMPNLSDTGVIEPITGKLYGVMGAKIFSFDIATEIFTILNGSLCYFSNGELIKVSDGFLYGTTRDTFCPYSNYIGPNNLGTIFKVNIINNSVQQVYQFQCDITDGARPAGGLIEALPGKLYGTAIGGGGLYTDAGVLNEYQGTIFEYNINTNTFTKKINFTGTTLGSGPQPMVNGNNGKLYGVCTYGGINSNFTNPTPIYDYAGTLFEYDFIANTITKLHDFQDPNSLPVYDGARPTSMIKTTTNNYFGISNYGVFNFNPINNSVLATIDFTCMTCPLPPPNAYATETLIEICRKPSYHEFIPDTFTPSSGTAFTYDIQNTNATTYVWKKGTTVLPLQTTAILNLPTITTADTGIYTCTMTNECGTTVTMNLYINVDNLGIDLMPIYKNNIILYPNPTLAILNIELPQSVEIQKCFISNSIGQTVFKSHDNKNKIDVSNLQQGVYIVSLETNYGRWNGKFVKE